MEILETLIKKKDKQIILCISKGQGQDLELDVYTKGELILTKIDLMMLKNITIFEMLEKDDFKLI